MKYWNDNEEYDTIEEQYSMWEYICILKEEQSPSTFEAPFHNKQIHWAEIIGPPNFDLPPQPCYFIFQPRLPIL